MNWWITFPSWSTPTRNLCRYLFLDIAVKLKMAETNLFKIASRNWWKKIKWLAPREIVICICYHLKWWFSILQKGTVTKRKLNLYETLKPWALGLILMNLLMASIIYNFSPCIGVEWLGAESDLVHVLIWSKNARHLDTSGLVVLKKLVRAIDPSDVSTWSRL